MGDLLLSILIPTIQSRRKLFRALYRKLDAQIREQELSGEVEILYFLDNGQRTIGAKRNRLVEAAQGRFIVFIDDDDDVCDEYVKLLVQAIKGKPDVDCIGIKGRGTAKRT